LRIKGANPILLGKWPLKVYVCECVPMLQVQTMPTTSVMSADAAVIPRLFSQKSVSAVDEICRPDGSVHTFPSDFCVILCCLAL